MSLITSKERNLLHFLVFFLKKQLIYKKNMYLCSQQRNFHLIYYNKSIALYA